MFERRLRIVYALVLLWFGVLGARLFTMQVLDAEEWREKSRELSRSRIRLAARRGEILDRHGAVLATDRLEQDLMVRLDHFDGTNWICRECGRPAVSVDEEPPGRCRGCRARKFDPGPEQNFSRLPALLGRTEAECAAALDSVRKDWRRHVDRVLARAEKTETRVKEARVERDYAAWKWTLAKDVPPAVVKEVSLDPARYRGLTIRSIWRRARVGGPHVRDIVGRVSGIFQAEIDEYLEDGFSHSEIYRMRIGRSGLERALEERLASRDGHRVVDRAPRGGVRAVLQEIPAQDGESVPSSIDLDLQNHIGQVLEREGARHGARGAFFVAMDPETGEVVTFVGWARKEDGVNLAFTPTVPGSVFKVVTAIAGVGCAELDPAEIFDCTGKWHGIGCHGHVHEGVDLASALAESCNGYFGHAADLMGIDLLSWWARHLGFGEPTGLGITREPAGLVPDREWRARRFETDERRRREDEDFRGGLKSSTWHRGETWQVGFGQGALLVTPIQVARLMALVANGGRRVKPSLVLGGTGKGTRILEPHALEAIRKGLEAVVDHGTAAKTELGEFRTAGKTGTGDLPGGMRNVAWFAGYAPREAPRIAFACCFVDVKGYGGGVAGPVCVEFLREFTKE